MYVRAYVCMCTYVRAQTNLELNSNIHSNKRTFKCGLRDSNLIMWKGVATIQYVVVNEFWLGILHTMYS